LLVMFSSRSYYSLKSRKTPIPTEAGQTVDGHEIAYSLKRDLPTHKISTMNSSLLALGESIARESLQQLCQFVILENSDGRVVSLRINDILMLTCISSKSTNLGMLLSAGRNTADSLAKILP